jgi:predicted ester cyclase
MSEANKAIVRRYREIYNTNQLDKLGEVLADNFTPHALFPGMSPALETYRQIHTMAQASFPDVQTQTEDLIAEGDKVVERWTQTQTHTGAPFFGLPPSGKAVRTTGISIYRIADGKIVEHWADMDFFGVMVQLGAIPAPGM